MSNRDSGTEGYLAAHTSPYQQDPALTPPRALGSDYGSPSPRESYVGKETNDSNQRLSKSEGDQFYPDNEPRGRKRRLWLYALIGLIGVGIVVIAVVVPVYYTVIKPRNNNNLASNANNNPGPASPSTPAGEPSKPEPPKNIITGGDGSEVTLEDGTKFTYKNSFGGIWYSDPNDPFNNNAQCNSWTPPLNTSWNYKTNRINGVNLGGWFVLEPFISPALYQKYPTATDEWTLSTAMTADTGPGGGLDQIDEHYRTFITEQDIAEIAGAGLNWIRLPVPYWAIEVWEGEPFLAKKSWPRILKVIEWCRKYGIRVKLDLHTIPGSQNGFNHSGKGGQVNFLNGPMGVANAQRALNYIRIFTEFFSQPQYTDVVCMFGIVNEALVSTIGMNTILSFYNEAHRIIREITGIGEGKGMYISIHDGFRGLTTWANTLDGADRINIDSHPYFSFGGEVNGDPIGTGTNPATAGGTWPGKACERWAAGFNTSRNAFGVTIAGEWSNGFNDCGLFLIGVRATTHRYPNDCAPWQDASGWSDAIKAGLKEFAMAQMDSFRDYFFWTWKIGNSNKGYPESPLWSYKLGLDNGWMPKDPREAIGKCASLGTAGSAWDGTFPPTATGGAGAGRITAPSPWPPALVVGADAPGSRLYQYVPTGTVATLPPISFPSPTVNNNVGDGWFNDQDTELAPTPQAGCTYPDPWDAVGSPLPASPCGVGARPTPAP